MEGIKNINFLFMLGFLVGILLGNLIIKLKRKNNDKIFFNRRKSL